MGKRGMAIQGGDVELNCFWREIGKERLRGGKCVDVTTIVIISKTLLKRSSVTYLGRISQNKSMLLSTQNLKLMQ